MGVPPAKGLCPSALPIRMQDGLGPKPSTLRKRLKGCLVADVFSRPGGERARVRGRAHAVRPYRGRGPGGLAVLRLDVHDSGLAAPDDGERLVEDADEVGGVGDGAEAGNAE